MAMNPVCPKENTPEFPMKVYMPTTAMRETSSVEVART